MKRVSIAPSSLRRKSTVNQDRLSTEREESERLDQETTLVLQQIDRSISRVNFIINDRIIPAIRGYNEGCDKVWANSGFWKRFFENAANVALDTFEEPINPQVATPNSRASFGNNNEKVAGAEQSSQADRRTVAGSRTEELRRTNLDEEDSLTWSVQGSQPRNKVQSSTPQRTKARDRISELAQLTDSNSLIPPTLISETPGNLQSPSKVLTIRQSGDNYHRMSISPRKDSAKRKRSSLIDQYINSSPTIPQPPVLLSEIGNETPRSILRTSGQQENIGSSSQRRNTPGNRTNDISSSARRTPSRRLQIAPLSYANGLEPPISNDSQSEIPTSQHVDDAPPPLPQLSTMEMSSTRSVEEVPNKRRRVSQAGESFDVENVFLEKNGEGRRSNTGTLFSNIVEPELRIPNTNEYRSPDSNVEAAEKATGADEQVTRATEEPVVTDRTNHVSPKVTSKPIEPSDDDFEDLSELGPLRARLERLREKARFFGNK
ncbi:ASK1 [[Candida] subhashii]|uniref:DASH complex subunit ASK1 n=1 Tax=[Candida] subhashii TaxID=561895 RepID=A0A8J5QR75_9ASCO|nr:ASK1 [[Candida] subhashii]KAG7665186.1 ASK1 [[Candida] subhashii]